MARKSDKSTLQYELDERTLELIAFSRRLNQEYAELIKTSAVLRKESRQLIEDSKVLRYNPLHAISELTSGD